MRALELKRGRLRLVERPAPRLPDGEARIRVLLAAICSTDLELRAGYMGFAGVPGHEFVGRVEEAPAAPRLVGCRVVGEINAGCGRCDDCRGGDPRHCPDRTVLGILGRDGAFADQLTLPVGNLHAVPESLPSERAVFVEPVAAAFAILEQVDVRGRRALVLGCGKLGALCARVLRLGGADVAVMTRRREAASLLERDGFKVVSGETDARWDLVVEASGQPDAFPQALTLVRPRGTIVLKSTCAASRSLNLAPLVIDEITVVGSRCGRFPPAIEALGRGDLRPEETIAGRFPLERFQEAFDAAEAPQDPARRKVLLVPAQNGGNDAPITRC